MQEPLFGFFDDDGEQIHPEYVQKPGLCLRCGKDGLPGEEPLCNMNRWDQRNDKEFRCGAFLPKDEE